MLLAPAVGARGWASRARRPALPALDRLSYSPTPGLITACPAMRVHECLPVTNPVLYDGRFHTYLSGDTMLAP
jgi:hypothetical protein